MYWHKENVYVQTDVFLFCFFGVCQLYISNLWFFFKTFLKLVSKDNFKKVLIQIIRLISKMPSHVHLRCIGYGSKILFDTLGIYSLFLKYIFIITKVWHVNCIYKRTMILCTYWWCLHDNDTRVKSNHPSSLHTFSPIIMSQLLEEWKKHWIASSINTLHSWFWLHMSHRYSNSLVASSWTAWLNSAGNM